MTPQEQQIIGDLFNKLQGAAQQARDPQAEQFVQKLVQQQPYAPYVMAQMIYAQQQAINKLSAQAQQHAPAQGGGGFLSSIFGGGHAAAPVARPAPAPQAAPAQGGSSFLGNAMSTAAGVAGGMAVGSILSNMIHGGDDKSGAAGGGMFGSNPVDETVVNNYGSNDDNTNTDNASTDNTDDSSFDSGGDDWT